MPDDAPHLLRRLLGWLSPSYRQKVFLLAAVPMLLAVSLIAVVVANQSRQLADREIAALEAQLLEAKRAELRNYISIARTGFVNIYGRAAPDDAQAQLEVTRILSSMIYGQDGYFFVFNYDGTNLVAPRQTQLIGRNWAGMTDINGVPITDELIRLARSGSGYHEFDWPKPSTGETARMLVYVTGLQDWKWAVGTGIFIDDVQTTVAASRAEVEARIEQTSVYILAIAVIALFVVFMSGFLLNLRERRLADAKLKELTQRVIDTQEEERGRVARELHDSISQILVGVRYALELARRRLAMGDARSGESLDKGIASLGGAIQEVRRISRDLRPGLLDDLGLGPALQALTDDFSTRTGIAVDFETVVFRNRLDQDARIALYRIAQEALTNIERHADASKVTLTIRGNRHGAVLRISDNGNGMVWPLPARARPRDQKGGLGLRNMAERIEQLDGTLRVMSSASGTTIEAQVPLSHMLPPEQASGGNGRKSA
ncbi:cache domain-containing protein [Flavimaricola marinus]|uniref:histidine kinase n=1 Tax=Flavimaricola marinus TaxID=1819565 RepID=A0A238LJW8_9RHOB|nr:cache domain-containing protein [Flavimaricola marinus]SMY09684.1 Signal transduction histidine-protein kinase/phosphatase DegS [Flavimaricola marinus]